MTAVRRRTFLYAGIGAGVAVLGGAAATVGLVESGEVGGRYALAPYLGQCGPAGHIPTRPVGPVYAGRFSSPDMRAPVGFGYALPEHELGTGLPVVLFLHGYGEDYTAAFTTYGLQYFLAASGLRLAVASVDGGRDSYWHRRVNGDDPPAMIVSGLLPRLRDAGLNPSRLALLGLSMGGFGALLLGDSRLHRLAAPYRPRAVAVSSPAVWSSYADTAAGAFDSPADWRRHDLLAPHALAGTPTRVDCGTDDPFTISARWLADRLPPGSVHFASGCHRPATWLRWFPGQLAFLGAALGAGQVPATRAAN